MEKDRMPHLTFPSRIASNSKGYIAVIDIHSQEYDGRVVVLNRNWENISFYTGQPEINTDCPFKPSDIELTPQENFLVFDYNSCCFRVLDERGDFKEYQISANNAKTFKELLKTEMSIDNASEIINSDSINGPCR